MNVRPQLDHYLSQARARLRWILSARGAVLLVSALLLVTLLAAWLLPQYGFTDKAALLGRLALFAVAVGAGAWVWWRWRAQERARGAAALERAMPDQSGRIATYLQESAKEPGQASVLLDLLAADALNIANNESLERRIRARRFLWPALGAVAGIGLLGALVFGGIGLGDGARQLWLGKLPPAVSVAAAAGGISVQPGDATIRRNQDLGVEALIAGTGDVAELHVRFDNGGEWETSTMERGEDGGYDYTIFAVRDGASYYVTAGRLKSKEHRITVVDLPTIESLKLSYDYPNWTGLPDREVESGGDVRAVAGTQVNVSVTTSAPLEGPLLVIDGSDEALRQSGATSRGSFAVEKDTHYRIATRFLGEIVPLTPDYAIEVVEDQKPEVRIVRPGRDYRATAIEEVPVRVTAKDDFRLDALELNYSVNGGDWQQEPLPAGSDDIEAAALLRLEQMQQPGPDGEAPLLVPGDLVSYFAEARDHSHSVQTDLFLIQVQPFEQRFTQSQAGGGGGGGGGGGEGGEQEGQISRRQREVLLATWNLQRNEAEAGERERERVADNARMLADVQTTLAEQAQTLIQRTQSRELTGQDQSIDQFVKALQDAAKAMAPAAQKLASMDLKEAVTHEQQALQHLLRAESSFRDIEVAMQQGGGGGGGGGAQAGRDVSEMTELELDLAKNQYETEQQSSSSSQQGNQTEDELARRLRELARRQEQLAEQARRQQLPPETQRWQQEQLRREAEQLRRELEQLAQQNSQQSGQQSGQQQSGQQQSGQQQSGQQQGGQQSGQQSGQRSAQQQGGQQQSGQQQSGQQQGGQQSARANSAAEAARQLAEATRQMASGDREAQARAAEQLNRAREQLDRARQQRLRADSERFEDLAESARTLANEQRAAERELRAATEIPLAPGSGSSSRDRDNQSGLSFDEMDRMAETRRELRDELEALQREMENTRRATSETTPRAARQLAEAGQELRDLSIAESIDMSARQIEAGRGRTAAGREPFVTDTLERLARNLEDIADTAATEAGRQQQQAGQADTEDLAAEVGNLRRLLDRAREQTLAQNRTGGDQNTSAPNAREGEQGQQGGGQQGQQGQGGQGQSGQEGSTPGEQQGGAQGGANPGQGQAGNLGGGNWRSGDGNGFIAGGGPRLEEDRPAISPGLRNQIVFSAEQLAQLREELRRNGTLTEADARVLQELTNVMRRSGTDPMNAEYQRMAALVNQVELIALKNRQEQAGEDLTRATETVDDSRQYRDNVAEYYRRLGGGNE